MAHFTFSYICKLNDNDIHSSAIKNKPVPLQNYFTFNLDNDFSGGKIGLDICVNQMGNRLAHRKRNDGS